MSYTLSFTRVYISTIALYASFIQSCTSLMANVVCFMTNFNKVYHIRNLYDYPRAKWVTLADVDKTGPCQAMAKHNKIRLI